MSISESMAGVEAVGLAAGQAGVPRALATDACSGVLALPESNPVIQDFSLPGMWQDWLLDRCQIMNP